MHQWRCSAEGLDICHGVAKPQLAKIVFGNIIGSQSRPRRHLLALCCSWISKIQSFDACLALVRAVVGGASKLLG